MERIFIVNESKETVYELSHLIQEMMESENMTQQACIDYFMDGLSGTRYKVFPDYTPTSVIRRWIIQDGGMTMRIKSLH